MLRWWWRSRVCRRKVVWSILLSIFTSRFDSSRAHPQQSYKEVQSRKTLRNLWPASRSLKKLNKKHKMLHWGWGNPMHLHSWKTTGSGSALLKRTRGLQQTWINMSQFCVVIVNTETGAGLHEVKLCCHCCWDCSWNIVSWFQPPSSRKMVRNCRGSSRLPSRCLGPRAAPQKLCLSLMKRRLRDNLLIAYNCMKELKAKGTNLFSAMSDSIK